MCPTCHKSFALSVIEEHADICCDMAARTPDLAYSNLLLTMERDTQHDKQPVKANHLRGITTKIPTHYTLKLFELVFSRKEAIVSSVEGKGEKLTQLDPNRMMAIHEQTLRHFKDSDTKCSWETTKKVIDSKCRMDRKNRCKTWVCKRVVGSCLAD
jgi:hypothetical protein